jgi:preprotein translocase subunit SecA
LAAFAAEAAAKAQESAVATKERPALRTKGIEDDAPPLTYTGPSEDGSAAVQRSGGGPKHAAPVGGSRRERREAARQQAKAAKGSRRR